MAKRFTTDTLGFQAVRRREGIADGATPREGHVLVADDVRARDDEAGLFEGMTSMEHKLALDFDKKRSVQVAKREGRHAAGHRVVVNVLVGVQPSHGDQAQCLNPYLKFFADYFLQYFPGRKRLFRLDPEVGVVSD